MSESVNIEQIELLEDFEKIASPFLEQNEAQNSLLLGLMQASIRLGVADSSFHAVFKRRGEVSGCAMLTPRGLILTDIASGEIELLVQQLRSVKLDPPSVSGVNRASLHFAEEWTKATSCEAKIGMKQRIYSLRHVQPPDSVAGEIRKAIPSDAQTIGRWIEGFHADALPTLPITGPDAFRAAERMIDEGRVHVWTYEDELKSMAAFSRPTRSCISISAVYTPPENRRRGYASATVAALSQMGLNSGKSQVVLYTDLANPTSNSIYMAIGYEPVCDSTYLVFTYP